MGELFYPFLLNAALDVLFVAAVYVDISFESVMEKEWDLVPPCVRQSDPPELQLCRVCRSPQFWSHYRSLQPLLEITPEFITSGCTAVCHCTPSPSSQYKAIRRTDRDTLAGVKPN